MEPKVVQKVLKQNRIKKEKEDIPQMTFNPKFSYFKDEGSGNNWAYGFNVHGSENYEKIKEVLKQMMAVIWESSLIKST